MQFCQHYQLCIMILNGQYRHEPVIFSHWVHLKLGHRFHAVKVCSDRDDNYCKVCKNVYKCVCTKGMKRYVQKPTC